MRRRTEDRVAAPAHRWMLSWSDFVTLLLVVFAAMYAKANHLPPVCTPQVEADFVARPSVSRRQQLEWLSAELAAALQTGGGTRVQARLLPLAEGVLLELEAKLLFASGDARLAPPLQSALESVAPVLLRHEYPIAIEGYADAVPIANRQYPSNWELSAARAASVARLFASLGVSETRIEVTGRGTNQAVSDNATPEARQANRRVRVLVRLPMSPDDSRTSSPLP